MNRAALIKALRDTAQSASNAIASNVSAPVDLLAAGLRGIGLPVNNPVGGSQWMAEKGLTRDVEMGVPRIVGETLGMAGPTVAMAKAPQIAGALNKVGENLAAGGPPAMRGQLGAIVWHGSPHKFDKFDASKIGTGEGAQAYGHGLYLAESPGVAESYQKALSGASSLTAGNRATNQKSIATRLSSMFGGDGSSFARGSRDIGEMARKMAVRSEEIPEGTAYVFKDGSHYIEGSGGGWWDVADGSWTPQGSLYKVDLPDEAIAKMLDWDKPLSQQAPEVLDVLRSNAPSGSLTADVLAGKASKPDYRGVDALLDIKDGLGLRGRGPGTPELSQWLRNRGIPGIRYLDGGSRGTGAGTSNFVVFPGNEDILKILERNGQPLGMMGVRGGPTDMRGQLGALNVKALESVNPTGTVNATRNS